MDEGHENLTRYEQSEMNKGANHLTCCNKDQGQWPSLVPIPLPFLVNVIQGSPIVQIRTKSKCDYVVNGLAHVDEDSREDQASHLLRRGDKLRIDSPHISVDWIVSPDQSTVFNEESFTLLKPYDHSRIVNIEGAAKENEISCQRLLRKSNKELPTVLTDRHSSILSSNSSSLDQNDGRISPTLFLPKNGCELSNLRVWKLISSKNDKRLTWRRNFDDGKVPWQYDFTDSPASIKCLGVRLKLSKLELLCKDVDCDPENSLHMQRVNYVTKVDCRKILDETFKSICLWHPIGKLIDHVKWSKFARKMNFLSGVKNAKHEVQMAFFRQSSTLEGRKLNITAFQATIVDIAKLSYPGLDPQEAFKRVLWDTIVLLPSVNRVAWYEAKLLAMKDEARLVASQIRLSAYYRRFVYNTLYKKKKLSSLYLNRYVRRYIAMRRFSKMMLILENDRIFRWRFRAIARIQNTWRCYYMKCKYKAFLEEKFAKDRTQRQQYQKLKREKRRLLESEKVYQRAHRIQRVTIVVTMYLKESKSVKDGSKVIRIIAYVPQSKGTFTFDLKEAIFREYMQGILQTTGPFSWHEMLTQNSLSSLTKKLMVRTISDRHIIIFRRRSITENGELVRTQCRLIDGAYKVLHLYISCNDIAVCTYDPQSCQQVRGSLSLSELTQNLEKDEIEEMNDIWCPNQQGILLDWLCSKIIICNQSLLFKFDDRQEKERELSATRIQSKWRQFKALISARAKVFHCFEKIYNREHRMFFYFDQRSKKCTWTKPFLLGSQDLASPKEEWRLIEQEEGDAFFLNPATGQTTYLTEKRATLIIQRLFRNHIIRNTLGTKIDLYTVSNALHFINVTRTNFKLNAEKLSYLTNYALLLQCLEGKNSEAKLLYEKAIQRSPKHPLILRAYAIFLLSCCECDRQHNEVATNTYNHFEEAKLNDPDANMFRPAIDPFYKWAVISQPKNPSALLNFALVYQCVFRNYEQADMLYRQAIAADLTCKRVQVNFKYFDSQRYPGGIYQSRGPSTSILNRCYVKAEKAEWGEWKLLVDPKCIRQDCKEFWYNILSKKTLFNEPSWGLVWSERVRRSSLIHSSSGWAEYFDPRLKSSFFENLATGEFFPNRK